MNYKLLSQDYPTFPEILLLTLGFSTLCLFFIEYLPYAIIGIFVFMAVLLLGRNAIIFLIITSYLTFVGEINPLLRMAIHIVGLGTLFCMFIRNYGLKISRFKTVPREIQLVIGLLFASMFISSIFSNYFILGIGKIVLMGYFIVVIYLIYSLIKNDNDVRIILSAMITSAVFMALSVLYNLWSKNIDIIDFTSGGNFRSGGFLSNYNAIAVYFIVGIISSIALLFNARKRISRYILISSVILLSIGLLITVSRSAFLALIVSMSIIIYTFNRLSFFKISFITLFVLLILLVLTPFGEKLLLFFRFAEGLSQRDHLWTLSWNIIKDRFLFGIGPGAYSFEMLNYIPVTLDSFQGKLFIELRENSIGFNNSHNFFLYLFTDMGVLGLITSILFPLVFIKISKKSLGLAKKLNSTKYKLLLCFTSVGIGMFARAFFESISIITYGWVSVDMPFWIIFIVITHYFVELSSSKAEIKEYV